VILLESLFIALVAAFFLVLALGGRGGGVDVACKGKGKKGGGKKG
jgi:hypothetical protein